jgi:hypothetical protein
VTEYLIGIGPARLRASCVGVAPFRLACQPRRGVGRNRNAGEKGVHAGRLPPLRGEDTNVRAFTFCLRRRISASAKPAGRCSNVSRSPSPMAAAIDAVARPAFGLGQRPGAQLL